MIDGEYLALLPQALDEALEVLAREGRPAPGSSQAEALAAPAPATAPQGEYALVGGVAVIEISGPIDRKARASWLTGEMIVEGQDRIRLSVEKALKDPAVSAILLSLNSPGGVVAGTKELADFMADAGEKKPLAAYADGLCASAAFWLAAATGRIYAPKTAQLGSIGVIAVLSDWTRAAEKAGIARTVLHSGKWKAAGSPDKELTDEERALFQERLSALHEIFAADVSRRLNLPMPSSSSLPAWAEGQTFLAEEALSLGLLTEIVRDRDEAIAILQSRAENGEENMTLKELKTAHPELVDLLRAEFAKERAADSGEDAQGPAFPDCGANGGEAEKAAQAAQKETLALLAAIGGAEIAGKVQALIAAGITPAQLHALAPFLKEPQAENAAPAASRPSSDEAARREMLAALQKAQGEAISAQPSSKPASALLADAERRAKEAGQGAF